jgi:sugar phosphate isomerase/epimerase
MSATRTGNYAIGFRRGWSDWQKNDLKSLAQWAKASGFEAIDLTGRASSDDVRTLNAAGLKLWSVDLLDFGQIMSTDAGKRKDLVAQNVAYVKEMAGAGAKAFFTCIIPGDPSAKRADNYKLGVECFTPIAHACRDAGAAMVIEGWPGGGPHFATLCCNPETYRAFLKDVGPGAAINYDPSHLIRLRIDHIRFLREFAPHVKHVHGKDTDLNEDEFYEVGTQDSIFTKPHGFGQWGWRYTIPGHGQTRWTEALKILNAAGFKGIVSIELEDENFNGSEAGEKAGLLNSLAFLKSV